MSNELRDVTFYYNAGGRGSRLANVASNDPRYGVAKALIRVGNPSIPLIEHHLNRAIAVGAQQILVGLGDQADYIAQQYRGRFVIPPNSDGRRGTGGDLLQEVHRYKKDLGKLILVHNIDTIVDIDEAALVRHHRERKALATIALTTSQCVAGLDIEVPNANAFLVDAESMVLHSKETIGNWLDRDYAETQALYQGSSVGVVVLDTEFLGSLQTPPAGEYSIYRHILGEILAHASLAAYNNGDSFFIDVGTEETLGIATQVGTPVQPYLCYGR